MEVEIETGINDETEAVITIALLMAVDREMRTIGGEVAVGADDMMTIAGTTDEVVSPM